MPTLQSKLLWLEMRNEPLGEFTDNHLKCLHEQMNKSLDETIEQVKEEIMEIIEADKDFNGEVDLETTMVYHHLNPAKRITITISLKGDS